MEGATNFLRRIKMKRKIVFRAVLVLMVQGTLLYADVGSDFYNYLRERNWNRMERVLNSNRNKLTDSDRRSILMSVQSSGLHGDERIRLYERVKNYNINPDQYDLLSAIAYPEPDSVVDYLLSRGVQDPEGWALKQALMKRRLNYVPRLLAMVNADNLDRRTEDNNFTALIYAAQAEHLDSVRRLVERGANVNLRATDGSTAASIAYDRGNIEIYNYLKANGAIDFEPRQAANQPVAPAPSTTTNVYVQPSTPVQPAPAPLTPAAPRLSPGFYSDRSVSGSQINLTMVYSNSTNATGTALHSINRTNSSQGTVTISGTQLVISWYSGPLSGVLSVYRIDSTNQFSGSGETWRAGL
jgi:hypothetical protein